jgi:RHS repeat-associated protein
LQEAQLAFLDATVAWYATGAVRRVTAPTRTLKHAYDAGGERVWSYNSATGAKTFTLRGLDNKPLREYTYSGGSWQWGKDYVWREDQLLATVDSTGTVHSSLDHLGTPRLLTNGSRQRVAYHEYDPFGFERTSAYQDNLKLKFTGHERDYLADPGPTYDLDYMHARSYSPGRFRFISVDPVGGDPKRPQSWNRYSYVVGNPLKYTDPFGEIFKLSGCGSSGTKTTCQYQQGLLTEALGESAKFLVFGEGGVVSLNISAEKFKALGTMQAGVASLIESRGTFTLFTGKSYYTGSGNASYFKQSRNLFGFLSRGGRIFVDPEQLPADYGGVLQSPITALAHEVGHAVGSLYPKNASRIGALSMAGQFHWGEGYPITFENRFRLQQGLQERQYSRTRGDYVDPGGVALFPWEE